jgi:hypothetical protein
VTNVRFTLPGDSSLDLSDHVEPLKTDQLLENFGRWITDQMIGFGIPREKPQNNFDENYAAEGVRRTFPLEFMNLHLFPGSTVVKPHCLGESKEANSARTKAPSFKLIQ